jgi:hypothetical protein
VTERDLAYYVDGLVEGRRGTLVQRQKDRSVWRVEEPGRIWFAKRGVTPKRRREIRREAKNARLLASKGLGATVVADGEHSGAMWIVTAAAPGRALRQAVFTWRREERRRRLDELSSIVRRMFDEGFDLPDLTSDHVFVGDDRRGATFIDLARLRVEAAPVSDVRRAAAFATFAFSLPWGVADRTDLVRFERRIALGDLRKLDAVVGRRISALADRTRWRHRAWGATREAIESIDVASGDDQQPVFDGLMSRRGMRVVRTLSDRENRLLDTNEDGSPRFFVKVFPPTTSGWSPAMREVAAIDLFQRAGILVNRLAAYAEDVDKGSMVAVKAARGEPLDDLLRRGVSVAERRALAVQTARIWRRMRECGLRHRDAYACHLFAAPWIGFGVPASAGSSVAARKANDPAEAGTPNQASDPAEAGTTNLRHELRLIDLTRAGRAPFPKERWFVKDAAALWHGCPKPPVTRTDAVRWLREYFRIAKLDARAKRFARRVAAKEARVAARQRRKAKR